MQNPIYFALFPRCRQARSICIEVFFSATQSRDTSVLSLASRSTWLLFSLVAGSWRLKLVCIAHNLIFRLKLRCIFVFCKLQHRIEEFTAEPYPYGRVNFRLFMVTISRVKLMKQVLPFNLYYMLFYLFYLNLLHSHTHSTSNTIPSGIYYYFFTRGHIGNNDEILTLIRPAVQFHPIGY
jgi:hypothetical protein